MADGDIFPGGSGLMKCPGLGQAYTNAPEEAQRHQAQHDAVAVQDLSARQPRTSKSQGHLRSKVKVTIQSPSRSSSSEALSKRGSVKAMAALFESQDSAPSKPPSPEKPPSAGKPPSPIKRQGTDGGIWIQAAPSFPCKCGRQPQTGPVWLRYSSDKSPESASGEEISSHSPMATQDERETPAVGNMASSVAAAAQTKEQQRRDEILGRPTQVGTSKSMPVLKTLDAGTATHEGFRPVPSLGTMVPYREQPPIAQHLNRPRPLSTPSPAPHIADEFPIFDTVPLGSATRPRGTTILYSQIQTLQRHLGAKNEEASQLRRQLEAQEDTEVGTLSEQLRAAHRDLSMWKERAESAEKRVKVFERFTTRLRTIRDALFHERQRRTDEYVPSTPTPTRHSASEDGDEARTADDKDSGRPGLTGRRAASGPTTGGERSDDSGKTEDAGVVAARIRKCLHRQLQTAATHHRALDRPADELTGITGGDGASSPREYEGMDIMGGAEKVWAIIVELLRMEDDGFISVYGSH